jgi:hypothetical protein
MTSEHFNDIIKHLELTYYNNLLKASERSVVNKKMIENKITLLKADNIIEETNEKKTELLQDSLVSEKKNNTNTENNDKKTSSETPPQKYNDDYLYKKQWNKLTTIHKKIKVKEFVNMLLINDENEKDEIRNKLSMLIDRKELTKKEAVIYDSSKGLIVSIPLLKFTNGKYIV